MVNAQNKVDSLISQIGIECLFLCIIENLNKSKEENLNEFYILQLEEGLREALVNYVNRYSPTKADRIIRGFAQ